MCNWKNGLACRLEALEGGHDPEFQRSNSSMIPMPKLQAPQGFSTCSNAPQKAAQTILPRTCSSSPHHPYRKVSNRRLLHR